MREDYIRYVERRRRIYAATVLLLFGLIVYAWIRPRPVGPEPTTDEDEDPTPTKSQLDRRAKSNTIIKKMGLPCNEDLPVIEDEKDIAPRGKEELTRRCMAVEICAVKGKTRDQAMIEKAIEQWGAADFFSPNERAFVLKMSPTEQECVDFAWRFECVHVLLWALGYVEDLNPPNLICDVQKEITIFSSRTWDQFIADASTTTQLSHRSKPRRST